MTSLQVSRAANKCYRPHRMSDEEFVASHRRTPGEGREELSDHKSETSRAACDKDWLRRTNPPPHLKWAENLRNLLNDKDGVDVFTKFLNQEGGKDCISFFYACEGMKKRYASGCRDQHQAIKAIYKCYVKGSKVKLGDVTRQEIADKINTRTGIDADIFDRAQKEVEENYLQNAYRNFLESDLYLSKVQQCDDDPSADDNDARDTPASFQLATLHEDREMYDNERFLSPYGATTATRHFVPNRNSRYATPEVMRYHPEHGYIPQRCYGNASHLKYSGYLPASAQDSELQSLSSDAHTDDTMSVTTEGSSLSDGNHSNRYCLRKQVRSMKRNATLNKDSLLHHSVIPRTQCVVPDRLAENDPDSFSKIVIEKLNKIKRDIDGYAKLNELLRLVDECKGGLTKGSAAPPAPPTAAPFDTFSKIAPQQLLFNMGEENDQAILDHHVSRVWNDSNCQSPLSPGQHSPTPPPPPVPLDRRRANYEWPANPYTTGNTTSGRSHRRERVDACSSDSGTVRDLDVANESQVGGASFPQYPVHYHKHFHHHAVANNNATGPMVGEETGLRVKETRRSSGVKKSNATDSSSSCVDSGVSLCDPCPPANQERVYSWVLDNEKYDSYNNKGVDGDNNSSSSKHKRSSHSSLSNQSASSKQGKKGGGASTSTTTGLVPAQPVAQDPGMPILPPPDTTSQLVEAKRRLEDEAAKGKIKKNIVVPKSSSGGSSKTCAKTNEPKRAVGGASSVAPNATVIGYCFSGESVPYRTKMNGSNITLKHFKALISKKGNYRYFFKRSNNEFGTGVVNEEVSDDNEILPLWEGKIFCTIDPIQD